MERREGVERGAGQGLVHEQGCAQAVHPPKVDNIGTLIHQLAAIIQIPEAKQA